MQRRDSDRAALMPRNRYSYDSATRQSRNFNGLTSRHNSCNSPALHHYNFNGPTLRRNGGENRTNDIRYKSFSNDSMSHQNGYYEVVNNYRGRFSSRTTHQERYTDSRVFQLHYVNGMVFTSFNGYFFNSN